jgi:replicative DNA helicase
MNTEHELVLSILKSPNPRQVLLGFDPNNLTTQAKDIFLYIKDFYQKYHKPPSTQTLEEKFGQIIFTDTPEPPEYYAQKIQDSVNKNKILMVCERCADLLEDPKYTSKEIKDFIDRHIKKIQTDQKNHLSGNLQQDPEQRLEYYKDKQKLTNRYKWGFAASGTNQSQLDTECPLVGGRIYIITARPSVGKTFLAAKTTAFLALQGVRVLFVSKELSYFELAERIDAMASGISYSKINKGVLDPNELDRYSKYVHEKKLNVQITNPQNCTQNTIGGLIQQHLPDLVIIDYIQLLKDANKADQRHLAVENIVYDLKSQAQEYQIPIILISSANRQTTESKTGPELENLSASDALGFAVDAAFSLYQTEEQKILSMLTLNTIKNRHGKKVKVVLSYDIDRSVIEEWSPPAAPPQAKTSHE